MRVLGPLNSLEIDALLHHFPQRRHVPQATDVLLKQLHRQIHLFFSGEASDPEAYRRVGHLITCADSA